MRFYYKKNKAKVLEANKQYRVANPKKFKKYQADYVIRHPERVKESKRHWVENNPIIHSRWSKEHPEKSRQIKREYKQRNSEKLKLQSVLRNRIILALRSQGACKNKRTLELVGCSIRELRAHLESMFDDTMTWENRGYWGWHIDHIKPLSLFDLIDTKQQKLAFHYTNLQPLWMRDNFSKKNKYVAQAES